jgi:hypothetical protein
MRTPLTSVSDVLRSCLHGLASVAEAHMHSHSPTCGLIITWYVLNIVLRACASTVADIVCLSFARQRRQCTSPISNGLKWRVTTFLVKRSRTHERQYKRMQQQSCRCSAWVEGVSAGGRGRTELRICARSVLGLQLPWRTALQRAATATSSAQLHTKRGQDHFIRFA